MIIDKNKITNSEEGVALQEEAVGSIVATEEESYTTNALCAVFNAIKTILSGIVVDDSNPNSKLLFKTVSLNTGQLNRIKNNKWNKEYAIAFPAVFMHFINIHYLVQHSRIGEGRATMRIQFVLNRLNNNDAEFELEGYEVFQKINDAILSNKVKFPALAERFQLQYFDQLESFEDGLQPFWIDYEVWFKEYTSFRYKDYVDRYVVVPPFTNHSDQQEENNTNNHEDHDEPAIEDVAGFETT